VRRSRLDRTNPAAPPAAGAPREAPIWAPDTPAAAPSAPAGELDAEARLDLADLERGRTAALIAALGRLQLSLDLLDRRAGRIEERLGALEDALRRPATDGAG